MYGLVTDGKIYAADEDVDKIDSARTSPRPCLRSGIVSTLTVPVLLRYSYWDLAATVLSQISFRKATLPPAMRKIH